MKQRGINTVRATRTTSTDDRWGSLDPDEWMGKVKCMTHPAYGERYFKNDEVANRESRGWVVVEYVDPTKPIKRPPGRPPKKPVEEENEA